MSELFESIQGKAGERFLSSREIHFEKGSGELFAISDNPIDPAALAEQLARSAADRQVTLPEQETIKQYPREHWLSTTVDGKEVIFPFASLESRYLDTLDRAAMMDVGTTTRFAIHPALQGFKERLVGEQIAGGRNLTDGSIAGIARLDQQSNRMVLRQVGYHDIFTTQNYGADVLLCEDGAEVAFDGLRGRNLREMLAGEQLPALDEDSLVTNSFGIGGLLVSGDGKLLFCRRRSNLGIASASGTFGYAAAGNLEWNDALLGAINTLPAHQALASQGIELEAQEELGVRTRYVAPRQMLQNAMTRLSLGEVGLNDDECSITPVSICRDGMHMGMPQSTYLLASHLPAREIVKRIIAAPDGKKEYDLVLALDASQQGNLDTILINGLVSHGIDFNAETRSSLASLLNQENGFRLLRSQESYDE